LLLREKKNLNQSFAQSQKLTLDKNSGSKKNGPLDFTHKKILNSSKFQNNSLHGTKCQNLSLYTVKKHSKFNCLFDTLKKMSKFFENLSETLKK